MQNSVNADTDYHAWMEDLVSSGNTCGSNANQDSNYVAGRDCRNDGDDLQECLPEPCGTRWRPPTGSRRIRPRAFI